MELFKEVLHEISAEPMTFAIEVVQFGILLLIIKALGFGFGGSKGMVGNMLAERRERIAAQLDRAYSAEATYAEAELLARGIVSEAEEAAKERLKEAERQGKHEAGEMTSVAQQEAEELLGHAHEALAREREEALRGIHDELLEVVTLSTRQVLDEGLSATEQRALIQRAVLESLDDLESAVVQ